MEATLAIGDFARATHMSIKTLRHYHHVGLLEPANIDARTGYRRYTTEQIPLAQVIRRFRELDMPIDDIHAVLAAPDLQTRNELISAHLGRLEHALERTRNAAASLRNLLERPASTTPPYIEHRSVLAAAAVAISATVDLHDATAWYHGALGELRATVAARGALPVGPAGGIYSDELFADEYGQATVFIPTTTTLRQTGRVIPLLVPAVELAVTIHDGPQTDIDRAYGSLATYVTEHAVAVAGPIREYYLIDRSDTPDETKWRTEIGWPIFDTRR